MNKKKENLTNNVASDTDKDKKRQKGLPIKTICTCAVLVALNVVANTFTVYMNVAGSNALSFTYTVCFLAGALCGPLAGFLTGACGDLLGWVLNPSGGAFNPFLTLTSGLLGLLPGIVFLLYRKLFSCKKNYNRFFPLVTVISYLLVWAICTNVNTVIMYFMYIAGVSKKYTSFALYYAYRTPWQTLFWFVNLLLSALLYPLLKKILKK